MFDGAPDVLAGVELGSIYKTGQTEAPQLLPAVGA
jgi:hypothetical protein